MRMRFVRRGGAVGAVVAAALVLGAMPASAAPGDGSAFALDVNVTLLGAPAVDVGPLAPSYTSGPTSASLANVNAAGLVTAGVMNTYATLDEATGVVQAHADIANVGLGLGAVLGLTGTIEAIAADCEATQAGVVGSGTVAGVQIAGIVLPDILPPNFGVDIGLAKVVFNEQIMNADGSLTVNAVHVYANALVATADIILAQARCGPAAPPIPLASGVGLWLGLGLLALAAVPAGAVLVRKRRAATV